MHSQHNKSSLSLVESSELDRLCGRKQWAFERVMNGKLDGHDHKIVESVYDRGDCAKLCLLEREFHCRSAEYHADRDACVLSREDRRTQPEAFRTAVGVDYIENQCAKSEWQATALLLLLLRKCKIAILSPLPLF